MKNNPAGYFIGGAIATLIVVHLIWGIGKWGKYEGKTAEALYNEGFSCELSKATSDSAQRLYKKDSDNYWKTLDCLLKYVSRTDTISLDEYNYCTSANQK